MRSKARAGGFGLGSTAWRRLIGLGVIGLLVPAAPAPAQTAESHPIDSALKMLEMKTDVGAMPGFVEDSRPKQEPDFLPVGSKHPDRAIKVRTPAEIAAATADLDAARDAQLAGKRPKPWRAGTKPAKSAPKLATDR